MADQTQITGTPSNPPKRLGDGNVPVALGVVKGRVHWELPPGQDWCAMDPENARQIAEGLAKAAYEARYGVKPADGVSRLATDKRLQMVSRVALVAGSLAREGKNNVQIAEAVVDVILREIT